MRLASWGRPLRSRRTQQDVSGRYTKVESSKLRALRLILAKGLGMSPSRRGDLPDEPSVFEYFSLIGQVAGQMILTVRDCLRQAILTVGDCARLCAPAGAWSLASHHQGAKKERHAHNNTDEGVFGQIAFPHPPPSGHNAESDHSQ